jgi:hypothetical protein
VFRGAPACQSRPAPSPEALNSPEPLHEAMQQLTNTMVYDIFSPPQASRVYSYASIAAYEVFRQGDTTWRSLAGQVRNMPPVPAPDRAGVFVAAGRGARVPLREPSAHLLARAHGLRAHRHVGALS